MTAITKVKPPLTMTSQEISELTGKRHDNVKRTIDSLVADGTIVQPQLEVVPLKDALGRPRDESVYRVKERDSYIVVARLSPKFTAKLVDRWLELEEKLRSKQAKRKPPLETLAIGHSRIHAAVRKQALADIQKDLMGVVKARFKRTVREGWEDEKKSLPAGISAEDEQFAMLEFYTRHACELMRLE